jgi:hypothetical protein
MLGVLTFSCSSCTDGVPHPLRSRRHFDMVHSQLGEGVDDSVDHCCQRRCRTPFPAGTDAKPVCRRGNFAEGGGEKWQRVGPRHRVVHEARRQQLPALRCVIAVLDHRLANALGNSAVRLTVQDQWIDGAPDVVNRCVADDFNLARFGINFDFADLRSVREAGDRKRLVRDAGERSLQTLWQVLARNGGRGDLEDADLAIGAGDTVSAALELDVDFARLER